MKSLFFSSEVWPWIFFILKKSLRPQKHIKELTLNCIIIQILTHLSSLLRFPHLNSSHESSRKPFLSSKNSFRPQRTMMEPTLNCIVIKILTHLSSLLRFPHLNSSHESSRRPFFHYPHDPLVLKHFGWPSGNMFFHLGVFARSVGLQNAHHVFHQKCE